MHDIEECYEKMYEFENNKELYNFRFKDTGIPMWMYIRAVFIRNVSDNKLANQLRNSRESGNTIKKSFISKYITKNPFFSHRKDILFAFWSFEGMKQHEDGLVFEELIMPYLQMFPNNTATLMDGEIKNKYELNCAYPDWKMDDVFIDILRYTGYVRKNCALSVEDEANIRGLMTFLVQNSPLQINSRFKKEIIWNLKYFAQNSKEMIKICKLYLQIVKPKITIICCASYPNVLRVAMILACKEKGVVTAELQHGLIAKNHANYHYCDYIVNNRECSKMLPEYYLTFGEYWNKQTKMPQKCNVIGYAKPVIKDVVPTNNKILFCADLDFDRYEHFLDELMLNLNEDTEIYFRFHPLYSTKKQRNRFKKFLKYPNFFAADEESLTYYMKECRYVIIDGSTVCYEALFMGRIVFVFNSIQTVRCGINNLSSVHLFNDSDEFLALWEKRDILKPEYHKKFFNINYKENYKKFLKKCGVDTKFK